MSQKSLIAAVVIIIAVLGGWAVYAYIDTSADRQPGATDQSQEAEPATGVSEARSITPTLFYIGRDDGGVSGTKIGCDDSLIATPGSQVTTDQPAKAALDELLSDKAEEHGASGLYNALHASRLSVMMVTISDDTVHVELSGELVQSGSCDSPRIRAQLEQTALTAAGVANADITVDGTALSELLSAKQ